MANFSLVLDTVTAPVAPDRAIPEPATMEVTPELVKAPLTRDNPVPRRLLNDEPLTTRLVVLAVTNEE